MALVVASLLTGLLIAELTLRFAIKPRAVMTRQLLTQNGVPMRTRRGSAMLTSADDQAKCVIPACQSIRRVR